MYKTNIVKTALYLRAPHPFPVPPRVPPLALHARYYASTILRVSLSARVYISVEYHGNIEKRWQMYFSKKHY